MMTFHQRFGEFKKQAHRHGLTAREYAQVLHAARLLRFPSEFSGITLAGLLAKINEKQRELLRKLVT